ncbi:MAG TPA: histidine kinase, partial [Nitrospira sp.]|nr:histidine kinase [Nitrospira sp.]
KAIAQSFEGVERITKIVRAMKEFAHPGGEEAAYEDLNKAIQTTVEVSRNEWKYVAEMTMDLTPDLPPVFCQLGPINQVVLNIIVNAAHAIGDVVKGTKQKGRITIATRPVGDGVEIRISDTGGGIPETIREKIFDPFFTTKPVGKGTGQGLAIARSVVVDKHGGRINVESQVDQGTTFIIHLPVKPKEAPSLREAA